MSSRVLTSALILAALASAATSGAVSTASAADPTPAPTATPTPAPVNPVPPTVSTGGPESLSRSGATLTGTVTPQNADTTYKFQYGTSTSYGLTSASGSVPAGTPATAVSEAITGLTTGTTYHYRVEATNAAGTTYGSDKSFATSAAPKSPSVTTNTVTALAANTVTLMGKVNPNGQATTYYYEYGLTTKYGTKTAAASAGAGISTVTFPLPIAGLTANTKYNYRIVASNATGTVHGSNHTFTTTRLLSGVTLGVLPSPVLWNGTAIVSGTIGGQGVGGVVVKLLKEDFPYTATYTQVATQTTSSTGAYAFSFGPIYQGVKVQVQTVTAVPVTSPVVTIHSKLYLKFHSANKTRTSVTLRGLAYPVLKKARASIQRRNPHGKWITVKHVSLHALKTNRSSFHAKVSRISRTSRYRAVISPNDGGAHVTTTTGSVSVPKR